MDQEVRFEYHIVQFNLFIILEYVLDTCILNIISSILSLPHILFRREYKNWLSIIDIIIDTGSSTSYIFLYMYIVPCLRKIEKMLKEPDSLVKFIWIVHLDSYQGTTSSLFLSMAPCLSRDDFAGFLDCVDKF
jgi:hypothetical protein